MENFLIGIEHDVATNSYTACYFKGESVVLDASTYQDAVLEADLLEVPA